MEQPPISSRQIYLNSKDGYRINPSYTSDIFFFFNDVIAPPLNVVMEISVVSASIPMSYNIINSTNNLLVYNTNQTFTIPVGNYNALELASTIQNGIGILSSVAYSSRFNKYTFASTQQFTVEVGSTCLSLLGFSKAQHSSNINVLTSDSIVNLSGISSIYVHSSLLTNNLDSRTKTLSNILCRIPVDTASYGILQYINNNNFKCTVNDKSIDLLRIRLEDDDTNLVQLNGQEWVITLQVDFIYKPSDYTLHLCNQLPNVFDPATENDTTLASF